MFEYKEMAKYYDMFYSNKSYDKEVNFLLEMIGQKKNILDVGCGTGIHASILEQKGYLVDGLDLNQEMLDIAKSRLHGFLYCANLLDFHLDKKYDAIISMFAVFNHLNNYEEFKIGIINSYNHLQENGILIIDLHNGRRAGEKENTINHNKRIMKWQFDKNTFKETTELTYIIDENIYHDKHIFLIYQIDTIKNILNEFKFKYQLYENYTMKEASDDSKNIQIIIYK